MLSFQGNTAPYLQYSAVRIGSIFRKAEADGIAKTGGSPIFTEPAELALVKKLCQFGEVLPMILDDHRPNLRCSRTRSRALASDPPPARIGWRLTISSCAIRRCGRSSRRA
jgi:hypothetical protein